MTASKLPVMPQKLTVRLTPLCIYRIHAWAETSGRTISALVEQVVCDAIDALPSDQRKLIDATAKFRLRGSVSNNG